MPSHRSSSLPDSTPIIIGAGQHTERLHPQSEPPFRSPVQLAALACQTALDDAGISATEVDSIAVIRQFADSAKVWSSPFGGSDNPPESVARRIGATPAHRIYTNAGGTEPLQVMTELLRDIARGEKKFALLTGAEAIASQRFALRRGLEDDWKEQADAPFENREYRQRFVSKEEITGGLTLPVRSYAIIENYQAHQMAHNVQRHVRYMAKLMAPFSEVAATNTYAQSQTAYTALELADSGPGNYPISLPYSKLLVAQDAVNQSAALLLTNVGNAREAGVNPEQWVYLESYAEGVDRFLTQRVDPGRSIAMDRVLRTTLDKAGARGTDMDLIDIYSCFPCAVHAACGVLDLPTDGTQPLTVTGGLPFFGGPGNNYTTHALAEMAMRLRGTPSRALVTANGGILSKHAAAILTTDSARATLIDWCGEESFSVNCEDIPFRAYATRPQHGDIISYTVVSRRDKADIGVVLAETRTAERFLASSTEPEITGWMQNNSPIGREIEVHLQDDRQVFGFQKN
jgi:acetyl-CoA C-acetyltransferase